MSRLGVVLTVLASLVSTNAAISSSVLSSFIGVYAPVSSCGTGCCCSTGPITIKSSLALDTVDVSGPTDGSAACFGMKVLTGPFIVYNSTTAVYFISALDKTLILYKTTDSASISLVASQCVTVATRTTPGDIIFKSSSTGVDGDTTRSSSVSTYSYSNTSTVSLGGATLANTDPSSINVSVSSPYMSSIPAQSSNVASPEQMAMLNLSIVSFTRDVYTFILHINSTATIPGLISNALQWVILRLAFGSSVQMYPVTAFHFEYTPVYVLPSQSVFFSLSFKPIGGVQLETPVFQFTVPTNITTTTDSDTTNSSIIDDWLGIYTVDGTCIPSEDCCCSIGSLYVDPVKEKGEEKGEEEEEEATQTEQQIVITGGMDGGEACLGTRTFEAVFALEPNDSNKANYNLQGITFAANRNNTEITIVNSRYPDCPSRAIKTQDWSWTNGTRNFLVNDEDGLVGNETYGARMQGLYVFESSKCTPSKTCCCGVKMLAVISNATLAATQHLWVAGTFDGGLGCYGFTNMAVLFTVDSNTTAIYDAAGLRFTIQWTRNYTAVAITDSFHTDCGSFATRYSSAVDLPKSNTAAHRSSLLSLLSFLLLFFTLLI